MAKNLFKVKEINLYLQGVLAEDDLLQNLWVEGEISGFKQHSSGHWYFTLKGENAALKCVIFRQWTKGVFFLPEDGMEVRVRGSIAVYERDGQYLLYGEEMTSVGVSNQYAQFCLLKEQLRQEGLFDIERKRPLPAYPKKIAVVTSADGAAWQDIQKIFAQKIPAEIELFPCLVQGEGSESSIVRAIDRANQARNIDVLIVSRGGGSKEDLAVFNSEGVTRAVAGSRAPVVSAVGHEIDFTLVDLAADVRVPTPTAAANLVLPDKVLVEQQLLSSKNRLLAAMKGYQIKQKNRLQEQAASCRIGGMIRRQKYSLQQKAERLMQGIDKKKECCQQEFKQLATMLAMVDPLQVLARGYGISSKELHGPPIKSVMEVGVAQPLFLELVDGVICCEVKEKLKGSKAKGK